MTGLLTVVLATVAGLVGFAVVSADDEQLVAADPSMGLDASAIQSISEEHPEAPLVLPISIPKEYGWAGVGQVEGDGQEVWARSSQFTSLSGVLVELCVKNVREVRGCIEDEDVQIVRRLGEYSIVLSIQSVDSEKAASADLAYWRDVELTTDYANLAWLPK